MRKLLCVAMGVTALAVAALGMAQAPDDSKPSIANVRTAQYPRVAADGRVTFRVEAPDARQVAILPFNGDIDHTGYNGLGKAAYPMTRSQDGSWMVTTPPAVPGFHYYTVVIDGASFVDPSSETFFGAMRELSAVEVPEHGVNFYLPKDVPHGEVRIFWYDSQITAQWQRVYVYLPPGYDSQPQRRYPVLYLRHGGGENETGWVNQGRVNFILDNLIAAGKAKPMIVVMGSGYADRPGASAPPPPGAPAGAHAQPSMDLVVKMTTDELIPQVDAHFRTLADRDHRAIAGLSMGAAQTLGIGLSNLDKFSAIGAFSRPPMPTFDVKVSYGGVMADAAAFNGKMHLLWFGAGTAETGIFNSVKQTRSALDQAGIIYRYVEYPGLAHEWQSWRKQLNDFAPLLFQW